MPQIDISNPLPGGMPPDMDINNIPGKAPENKKDQDEDTRPKNPPCPNCGKYHWPFSP